MKNYNFLKRLLNSFLFLIIFNGLSYSQEKFTGFSLNPKFGLYCPLKGGVPGSIGGVEFNILRNKLILSFDYFHSKLIFIGTKEELLNQCDLLVGKYFDNSSSSFRLQVQGGIGTLNGITYDESKHISTTGIPLKVGLKWVPSGSISFGVDLQAKLNAEYPIYMIMVSIEIGILRRK